MTKMYSIAVFKMFQNLWMLSKSIFYFDVHPPKTQIEVRLLKQWMHMLRMLCWEGGPSQKHIHFNKRCICCRRNVSDRLLFFKSIQILFSINNTKTNRGQVFVTLDAHALSAVSKLKQSKQSRCLNFLIIAIDDRVSVPVHL